MADPELLVAARTAVASGQNNVARGLLVQIVRADQSNGEAWHLLSQILDDPAQKAECVQRAKAAGYEPQARRIVFPVEQAPEPAPPATPAPSPAPKLSPVAPQDLDALRATVTPAPIESPRRRPTWIYAVIGIILIVVVIAFILLQLM